MREFDKFNERAMTAVQNAKNAACHFDNPIVGTDHLLLGILQEGYIEPIFDNQGIKIEYSIDYVQGKIFVGNTTLEDISKLTYSPEFRKVIRFSTAEAELLGRERVGPECLFLGVLRNERGIAFKHLKNFGSEYAGRFILREMRDFVRKHL
ncbi:MAG: hypothetical protein IIA87_05380 [Nanoarchaeota archaeon]|nr:hypothetical protein [Nanoarchaeota archaeon]